MAFTPTGIAAVDGTNVKTASVHKVSLSSSEVAFHSYACYREELAHPSESTRRYGLIPSPPRSFEGDGLEQCRRTQVRLKTERDQSLRSVRCRGIWDSVTRTRADVHERPGIGLRTEARNPCGYGVAIPVPPPSLGEGVVGVVVAPGTFPPGGSSLPAPVAMPSQIVPTTCSFHGVVGEGHCTVA